MTVNEKKQNGTVEEQKEVRAKKVSEQLAKVEVDLSVMLREGHSVETVKGKTLKVPAITGRAEKQAIKIIVGYLRNHGEIIRKAFAEEGKQFSTEDVLSFVIDVAEDGYESVQDLVCAITGKDKEWVEDNLLIADLVAIVAPFVKAEAKPILAMLKKGTLTGGNLGQKITAKLEEARKTASEGS